MRQIEQIVENPINKNIQAAAAEKPLASLPSNLLNLNLLNGNDL
jgi:hypothetical protein